MLWDGTYGLSSLTDKTRRSSNHLQISGQRQHFLLSYLKTLSVGLAGDLNRSFLAYSMTILLAIYIESFYVPDHPRNSRKYRVGKHSTECDCISVQSLWWWPLARLPWKPPFPLNKGSHNIINERITTLLYVFCDCLIHKRKYFEQ